MHISIPQKTTANQDTYSYEALDDLLDFFGYESSEAENTDLSTTNKNEYLEAENTATEALKELVQ